MKEANKNYVTCVTAYFCFLALIGCSTPRLDITLSEPHVYSDSQVRKTLAERRQALSTVATTIQDSALQEIIGIRQAQQTTITVSGQPATSATTTAPTPPSTSITLPTAPTVPASLGLTFQSLLGKVVEKDQLTMGLQLLYLGDQSFLDTEKKILLLRFDVSVNDYEDATNLFGWLWGGEPQFARIAFQVTPKFEGNPITGKDGQVKVYHLMPEFSSITAQESLISSHLDSLSIAGAGTTGTTLLQGTASNQRVLEESLVSILQEPLEFAIYGPDPNHFGFGFGPRRRIEKRSWINPFRMFGNKYDLKYVLEPGPRELYALLVVPCAANSLEITHKFSTSIEYGDLYQSPYADAMEVNSWGSPSTVTLNLESAQVCRPPADLAEKKKEITVMPQSLTPNLTNSLLITTSHPVSSESSVWIGPVAIPPQNISVMGRYQLRVTVPPNEALKARLKAASGSTVESSQLAINGSGSINMSHSALFIPTGGTTGTLTSPVNIKAAKATIDGNRVSLSGSFTESGARSGEGVGSIQGPATMISVLDVSGSGTFANGTQTCNGTFKGQVTLNQPGTVHANGSLIGYPNPPSAHFLGSSAFKFIGDPNPIPTVPNISCTNANPTTATTTITFPVQIELTQFAVEAAGTVVGRGDVSVSPQPPTPSPPATPPFACNPETSGLVPNKVCLFVVTPGVTGTGGKPSYLGTDLILLSGQSSASGPFVVEPASGQPGRAITLTVSDPSIDLRKATAVTIGGQLATIIKQTQANQIVFRVPVLANGPTSPTETDIFVSLPSPPGNQIVVNTFTYIPPTPQAKTSSTTP